MPWTRLDAPAMDMDHGVLPSGIRLDLRLITVNLANLVRRVRLDGWMCVMYGPGFMQSESERRRPLVFHEPSRSTGNIPHWYGNVFLP